MGGIVQLFVSYHSLWGPHPSAEILRHTHSLSSVYTSQGIKRLIADGTKRLAERSRSVFLTKIRVGRTSPSDPERWRDWHFSFQYSSRSVAFSPFYYWEATCLFIPCGVYLSTEYHLVLLSFFNFANHSSSAALNTQYSKA